MSTGLFLQEFKRSVGRSVQIFPSGEGRYKIFTPFCFDDGDHFVIVLKQNGQQEWVITDEGHTFMHLSYWDNLDSIDGIVRDVMKKYGVTEKEGVISVTTGEISESGKSLYDFIQALLELSIRSNRSHILSV